MADNLERMKFGIEDTMELGMGNTELLNDLMAPESATGNPDDVKPLIKESKETPPPDFPSPKVNEIRDDVSVTPNAEEVVSKFLSGGDEEEEEEETPITENVAKKDEPQEQEEGQSTFSALSKDLFKLGVFSLDEEEEEPSISTGEEFLERFNSEKKKGAVEIVDNFIGQFGDDYRRAFDAIYVKGVNPREYFGAYNNIINFSELDMTKEENQVLVVQKVLADQEFEPADITTEIDRLKNYGDLESVATKHHKVLMKKEAIRMQQMEAQAEQDMQRKQSIKAQYIQNVQTILQEKVKTKEFDGIPLNPKLATELQDYLLVDKYKTSSGETLTDFDRAILELKRPENHALKVKVALLLKILEKDPTLSTIQKGAVTKKTDLLFEETARQKGAINKIVSTQNRQQNNSWNL